MANSKKSLILDASGRRANLPEDDAPKGKRLLVEPTRYGILAATVGAESVPAMVQQNIEAIALYPSDGTVETRFPVVPVYAAGLAADVVNFRQIWSWWLDNGGPETAYGRGKVAVDLPDYNPVLGYMLELSPSKFAATLRPVRVTKQTGIPFMSNKWKMRHMSEGVSDDVGWSLDMSPEGDFMSTCATCGYCITAGDAGITGEDAVEKICTAWPDGYIPAHFVAMSAKNSTWQMCWVKKMCPYYTVKKGAECAHIYRRWQLASARS